MTSKAADAAESLLVPLHVSYIQKLGEVRVSHKEIRPIIPFEHSICAYLHGHQSQDDLAYHLTSHLRLNAVYWGLTALCIMEHKDALDRQQLLDFVMSCWDEKAGTCKTTIF